MRRRLHRHWLALFLKDARSLILRMAPKALKRSLSLERVRLLRRLGEGFFRKADEIASGRCGIFPFVQRQLDGAINRNPRDLLRLTAPSHCVKLDRKSTRLNSSHL